ncbi:MAG: LVIVD repeat-containing protein [Candidatus Acidiferrales bacterium]
MSKVRHGANSSEGNGNESGRKREGLSRRELLKGTAGAVLAAAGAGLAGALGGRAQNAGLYTSNLPPELPLPLGSLNYLDRKQYIHNMEIVSHLSGSTISGGEPLMVLWAKGKQRLLPAGGGFVDISEPKNPVVLNKGVIKGGGCVAYNTKLKKWIMMCTAAQPLTGAILAFPHGQYDKELRDKVLAYKGLRGIRTYDITDPTKPNLLQEFSTGEKGNGTHHNFYDGGRYAYLDCGWDDQLRLENHQRPFSNAVMIVDLSDPSNVQEVSRWWVPGQRIGEEEEYKKYIFAGDKTSWTGNHGALSVAKRVEDGGTIGYGGFGAFGMYCLDLSDIKHPKPYGSVQYEFNAFGTIPFHTVLPVVSDAAHPRLQNLLVCTHEALEADCREVYHTPYVVDVKDPRNPKIVGFFPRPQAPQDAPYTDFCFARGRFGSHNTQCLVQPGASKPSFVAMSWFNAGVRIFDISDPTHPKEVAWFVPPRDGDLEKYETWWRGTTENVFVEWDRNLIWIGTHEGTYCLSTPALGKPVLEPRKIEKWSLAHCNAGWDDQTARSFYFGRSLSQIG